MGRSKLRTRTSYFIVTTYGNLRKINPILVALGAIFITAASGYFSTQCFMFNQRLINERKQIQEQLAQLNSAHQKLEADLQFCEKNKGQISQLLYFNSDSEKSVNEK